jgi:hypothetical protein
MDEARAVLERLERIEALDARAAAPDELLAELRALVREAESWARRERDPEAQAAAARCADAIDAHAIVPL